jgi:hypothetical protein
VLPLVPVPAVHRYGFGLRLMAPSAADSQSIARHQNSQHQIDEMTIGDRQLREDDPELRYF